jgi:hypothetical protein
MNAIKTCTLYKTDHPQTEPRAEFYALTLYTADEFHSLPIFLREIHGWWHEEKKRIVHFAKTFDPEEGFATLEEAEAAMDRQIEHRASEEFRHLFTPTPPHDLVMYSYRLVKT